MRGGLSISCCPECHNSHVVTREAQATTNNVVHMHRDCLFLRNFYCYQYRCSTSCTYLECLIRELCHIGYVGTLFHCFFTLVGNKLGTWNFSGFCSQRKQEVSDIDILKKLGMDIVAGQESWGKG